MTEPTNGPMIEQGGLTAEDPVVETHQIEVSRRCMDFVSQYRSGTISKVRALNQIFGVIYESDVEEEDQDKITGHFLNLLNEVERSFNNPAQPVIAPTAANSSRHVATGRNGGTTEPTGAK